LSIKTTADGSREIHDPEWLARFHRGDRELLDEIYRIHFSTVQRRVNRVLSNSGAADRETVIFRVFERLIESARMRSNFKGGRLDAWLARVSHNAAIDHTRRRQRERPLDDQFMERPSLEPSPEEQAHQHELEALLLEFREGLSPALDLVFEARYMADLSQYEAGRKLKLARTTLASREKKIRQMLKRFFLRKELRP